MKLIKKNTPAAPTFNVGDLVRWNENHFDGRVTETIVRTGTIIKLNRKTVDVQRENGDIYRGEPAELAAVKFC
jgi:hypothetical protein